MAKKIVHGEPEAVYGAEHFPERPDIITLMIVKRFSKRTGTDDKFCWRRFWRSGIL